MFKRTDWRPQKPSADRHILAFANIWHKTSAEKSPGVTKAAERKAAWLAGGFSPSGTGSASSRHCPGAGRQLDKNTRLMYTRLTRF
jgi:hypothetical protein